MMIIFIGFIFHIHAKSIHSLTKFFICLLNNLIEIYSFLSLPYPQIDSFQVGMNEDRDYIQDYVHQSFEHYFPKFHDYDDKKKR